MNDTEFETPVIFTWADRESSSWWLAAFIFLSFLLHSAAFFVFQGKDPVAPRTVRTSPIVQSVMLYEAMTKRSFKVDFDRVPGMGHVVHVVDGRGVVESPALGHRRRLKAGRAP